MNVKRQNNVSTTIVMTLFCSRFYPLGCTFENYSVNSFIWIYFSKLEFFIKIICKNKSRLNLQNKSYINKL